MRVALVHDWLDRRVGGAERVLLELARIYSDAPVHTLLFAPEHYGALLAPERVRTSWLQGLPAAVRRRPRYLLPLIPSAVEQWDLSGYDVVISSSSAFVKNVLTPPSTTHVCYCHTPMRFAWDYWPRYVDEMRLDPVRRLAVRAMVSRLRVWDLAGASRVDHWIANSRTTAARIAKYYRVADATVIHPPVDIEAFEPCHVEDRGDFYVTLSTLTEYKRIDLAIRAFNISGRRLVVIGDGPDRARLEELAGPTVSFAGHVADTERARLLARARGLVFPNQEDFGIAPVEALASGTPVVALGRGGLTETVEDGRTGVFFDEESPLALNDAVDRLERLRPETGVLVAAARRFDASRFREAITAEVERARAGHAAAHA